MKNLFVSFWYSGGHFGNLSLEWENKIITEDDIRKLETHLCEVGVFHPYGMNKANIINFRRME